MNKQNQSSTKQLTDKAQRNIEKFTPQTSLCNYQHILYCDCQRDRINKCYEETLSENKSDFDEFGGEVLNSRLMGYKDRAVKSVAKFCELNDVRCPYEKALVVEVLESFDVEQRGLYDLSNSNVYLILKSLVSQLLSAHRLKLYGDRHGIVIRRFDKDGNGFYSLNPSEEMKLKFDNAVVSAVKVLNDVVFGAKSVNLNLEADKDSFSLKDFMSSIRSVDADAVDKDVSNKSKTPPDAQKHA